MSSERKLKVLIACEESQNVCKAFRGLGHEAYSNDIMPCSGGHPEWHLQMDCFEAIKLKDWDLMIAHPPCTYLSRAGARWLYPTAGSIDNDRLTKLLDAKGFFYNMLNVKIPHIAIENPTPLRVANLPKPTQVIQPYEFGHPYSKRTLLWLRDLPQLIATEVLSEYEPYLPSNTGGKKRGQKYSYKSISQKESSKTFEGIAKAMAEQWSEYILNQ